jgi:hypothetical protein
MNENPTVPRLPACGPAYTWCEIGAVFEARATHERKLAVDLRINGRRDLARVHSLRAEVFDEAAVWCRSRERVMADAMVGAPNAAADHSL